MKDIVVAVDFSKGSTHALDYAVELANITQVNITLVWVDNVSPDEPALSQQAKELRNEAKQNIDELIATYKEKLNPGKITYKLRKGKVYHELATFLKQSNCCMLVVGAHGTSGFEEYWIGTNALRIISSVLNPVLTVKYNYEISRGIRKIVFPLDHSQQTLQKLPFVADLAKATGADVSILAINSSNLKSMQKVIDSNVTKVEKHFEMKGVNSMVERINSDNLAQDIISHAKSVDADLITIMTKTEDEVNNVMLGQFAQQLVNFAPVPVLSIHPNNSTTIN